MAPVYLWICTRNSGYIFRITGVFLFFDANGSKQPYNESNGNCNNFAIQDSPLRIKDILLT